VQRWRDVDQAFGARVEALRAAIDRDARRPEASPAVLEKLVGALLGYARRRSEALARLDAIAALRPLGCSRPDAERAFAELSELERARDEMSIALEREVTVAEEALEAQVAALDEEVSRPLDEPQRSSETVAHERGADASTRRAGEIFVPKARAESVVVLPDEELPRVGRLIAAKSGRALVIERWDQLDSGEAEAARLGARLVAAEGAR
jgi:hypothetical protein